METALENTAEGLAAAAAVRNVAKRRVESTHSTDIQPAAKRLALASNNDAVQESQPPVKACTHEVHVPEGFILPELDTSVHGNIESPVYKGTMAKEYPFALDPFQLSAIACIERNESVLVAAHTSAGKTVVADYAIAKSLKAGQRVVYTSPIKALSNQKYRELKDEFDDVGLMTGDVVIDPNASCIVMTTEILRSMIYKGAELLREIAWVVFDEIHYMQDRERGVVWEETLIFLPKGARAAFLSATLPNASEFAQWVSYIHRAPCHVVYTDYRPTPLAHYCFPVGSGQGLHLVVDTKGRFREENFKKMGKPFESNHDDGKTPARRSPSLSKDVLKVLTLVKSRQMEPVIAFSFNRTECERLAMEALKKGKLDFNDEEEKEVVRTLWHAAMLTLSEDDRQLPAISSMLELLLAGIGVHHSGLLPPIKEAIEICFQHSLVKCLFATETFAMGLNMPARTVIFTALRKWDGEEERFIGSGEYIQMSGRAGRRGMDDKGYVIVMAHEDLPIATCKHMMLGGAIPLVSSFKLSYYTLLNLARRMEDQGQNIEYVISHSFSQFQHERELPELEARLEAIEKELESGIQTDEYSSLMSRMQHARDGVSSAIRNPEFCLPFLRPGRLASIGDKTAEWGYGVVVNVLKSSNGEDDYILDVLLCCQGGSVKNGKAVPAPLSEGDAEIHVISVPLSMLSMLSTLRIAIPQDLRPSEARKSVLLTLRKLSAQYPPYGELPILHPVKDMGIADPSIASVFHEYLTTLETLKGNPLYHSLRSKEVEGEASAENNAARKQALLLEERDAVRKKINSSQLTSFKEESARRLTVLRRLGHVDSEGMVTKKGLAACEITAADELLATELMFDAAFNSLDVHQLAAMVSCLVPVEKSNEEIQLTRHLAEPLSLLQRTGRMIAQVSRESGLDEVDLDAYVESFKPTLMDVVSTWSKGGKFRDLMDQTSLFEGSVVRGIRRLDELMHELQNAALSIGDHDLAKKLKASRETIRRGIIFAASLFV